MKTTIQIEIKTKDDLEVYPEEGMSKDDFKGKEEELTKFQTEFRKDLHDKLVSEVKDYFKNNFEENFLDELTEESVEGYDNFEEYGITINVN